MIESARKSLPVLFVVVLVITIGTFVIANMSQTPSIEDQVARQLGQDKPIGRIGVGYFSFKVADTPAERTQGLSGQEVLKSTEAMLFVFDEPKVECFWMKDMKFAIDILWFDESRKLIYEKRNVSPSTYPESFCSDQPTKYVVEVTAGVAAKNQIKIGDKLDVEL